jgi:cell division protein FtsQ
MAAVVTGGRARSQAKPSVKTKAAASGRPRKPKSGGYVPAKLSAAKSLGLAPLSAVTLAGGIVLLALAGALYADQRVHRFAANVATEADHRFAAMGMRVATLTVQGATPAAQADIVRAAAVPKGEPIIHVDLAALRQRVENVGWVKKATVVRLLPDTIVIAITQRQTLAVWQHQGRTLVVDSTGRPIPEADPGQFADLPLVVGDGAAAAAPAILPVIRSRPRLTQNLEALVRVDDRRWDVRMKDGGLIQLPASGEEQALAQLDQIDQKSRILDLGFSRIDLRDPEMVAVRPKDAAPPGQLLANGA